jgi:hypothetical protein
MKSLILVVLLLPLSSPAQNSDTTPPGAPTEVCSMDGVDASTPIRILLGPNAVPYAFACAQHPGKPCIGKLDPGLVVSVGPSSGTWSCVSGGDSTSGWVPTSTLAELPTTPKVPLSEWIGWWEDFKPTPGIKSDRLLITHGNAPGTLHISGRAYWYGPNDNVHYGQINTTDAKPVGPYLHVVEGDTPSSCVLDLHFNPTNHTFTAYDNANCGGMNVRFSGKWTRFSPSTVHRK